MRRLSYILLAVVALQLVGVRLLCSPIVPQMHDCCPSAQKAPTRAPASVPPCCRISTIPYQGNIAQTAPASDSASIFAEVGNAKQFQPIDPYLEAAAGLLAHRQVASPPLEPLRQTCLLLI